MKQPLHRISDAFLILQSLTGLAALSFLSYLGFFSRYWADDFCYLTTFENSRNIFEATQVVYTSWSNRYANILFVGLIDSLGLNSIRYFPGIMIGLLVLALSLAVYQLGYFLKRPLRPLPAFNLGLFLAFFTILQTPNRFQSVYWMMGLVTYFAPVVFLTFMIAIIARAAQRESKQKLALLLLALLAFLAGGLSETTLTFQITFFALALAIAFFLKKTSVLPYLGIALVASLLALLVVFLAPGNSVRLGNIPESEFSLSKISLIFIFSLDFIQNSIRSFMLPAGISVLSGFGLGLTLFKGQNLPPRFGLTFVILAGAAYTLIASLVAPSIYVYGDFGYPEARALFPAQFVLTTSLIVFGLLLGRLAVALFNRQTFFSQSFGMIVVTSLLLVVSAYPLWFLYREIPSISNIERYAQTWDQRDSFLREQQQQGSLEIVLDGIQPPGGLIDLRQSPTFWINVCVANFYNLNSIAVFP